MRAMLGHPQIPTHTCYVCAATYRMCPTFACAVLHTENGLISCQIISNCGRDEITRYLTYGYVNNKSGYRSIHCAVTIWCGLHPMKQLQLSCLRVKSVTIQINERYAHPYTWMPLVLRAWLLGNELWRKHLPHWIWLGTTKFTIKFVWLPITTLCNVSQMLHTYGLSTSITLYTLC